MMPNVSTLSFRREPAAARSTPTSRGRARLAAVRTTDHAPRATACSEHRRLVPIAWMLSTSLKPTGTEYVWPIQWIPDRLVFDNYVHSFAVMNFVQYYRNTFTIAILEQYVGAQA